MRRKFDHAQSSTRNSSAVRCVGPRRARDASVPNVDRAWIGELSIQIAGYSDGFGDDGLTVSARGWRTWRLKAERETREEPSRRWEEVERRRRQLARARGERETARW